MEQVRFDSDLVIGGWDGVKTLNSVETYNEENER